MLLSASALGTRCMPLGLVAASREEASVPLLWSCSVCSKCSARANGFCQVEPGRWKCVICGEWTALESDKTREFGFSAFEVASSRTAGGSVPGTADVGHRHGVLALDENLNGRQLLEIRDALVEALARLPDDFYFGLVTFGKSVRIYELNGVRDRLSCEVFSGVSAPTSDEIRDLARHESTDGGTSSFIAPLQVCRYTVAKILTFMAESSSTNHSVPSSQKDNISNKKRCTGLGVEWALNLLKVADAPASSLIVATTGPCTIGPGCWRELPLSATAEAKEMILRHNLLSRSYFENLGCRANEIRAGVDIFCLGSEPYFGLSSLHALTRNIYLRLSMTSSDTFFTGLSGHWGGSKWTELRLSDRKRLSPVHVTGADRQSSDGLSFYSQASCTVFLEDKTSSRSNNAEDIYLQALTCDEKRGKEVIATYRFSVTRPFTVMDGDTIAVVVAKRACIIAEQQQQQHWLEDSGLAAARLHVENEIHNVSKLVRDGTMDQSQFDRFALSLFHFYRGPLLGGSGSQNGGEDAVSLRSHFLYLADHAHALLLMLPALFSFRWNRLLNAAQSSSSLPKNPGASGEQQAPKPAALSTLSLQSDCCLVMDTFTEVFVWFGSEVPLDTKERKEALAFANDISRSLGRYPIAPVIVFEESSPRARWLRSRLAPDHKELQQSKLAGGDPSTRKLLSKLWACPRNDLTYNEFLTLCLGKPDLSLGPRPGV